MDGHLKELNFNDMLHLKITLENVKSYKEYIIYCYRHNIGLLSDLKDIEKIYYATKRNDILFIKFKNDNVLKGYYIKEIELI